MSVDPVPSSVAVEENEWIAVRALAQSYGWRLYGRVAMERPHARPLWLLPPGRIDRGSASVEVPQIPAYHELPELGRRLSPILSDVLHESTTVICAST